MKKIFAFLLVVLFLVISIITIRSQMIIRQSEIEWATLLSMIAPRSNVAVVELNNKCYIIAGNDRHGATHSVWAFSPKREYLQELSGLHVSRFAHAAAVYGHKLYVFGGMQTQKGKITYLDSVESYDPGTNQWEVVTKMPIPRARFGLAVYGGRFYLIGGVNSASVALKSIDIYNPETNHWSVGLSLPSPRNRLAAVDVNRHLYVIGGSDANDHALNSILEYSPELNSWQKVGFLNHARKNFGASAWHNKIIVVGGWARNRFGSIKFIASTEQFNPITRESKVVGYLPRGRDGVRILPMNNKLYLFGGYNKKIKSDIKIGKLLI